MRELLRRIFELKVKVIRGHVSFKFTSKCKYLGNGNNILRIINRKQYVIYR